MEFRHILHECLTRQVLMASLEKVRVVTSLLKLNRAMHLIPLTPIGSSRHGRLPSNRIGIQ